MRAKNAFTRAVASGSSSGSAARLSARSSFNRFRLVVVTIAGLRSSLAEAVRTRAASRGVLGCAAPSSRTGAGCRPQPPPLRPPDWAAAAFRGDDRRRLERDRLPLPRRALVAVGRGDDAGHAGAKSAVEVVCQLSLVQKCVQRPARIRGRLRQRDETIVLPLSSRSARKPLSNGYITPRVPGACTSVRATS